MPINFNDSILNRSPKDLNDKTGIFNGSVWRPYNDITEALNSSKLIPQYRHRGLTIYILKNNQLTEYWWRDGVADNQLIEKTVDSSGFVTVAQFNQEVSNRIDGDALLEDQIDLVQDDINTHESRTDNPHNTTKAQVGLSNADNTSDLNKPISTATQAALSSKANQTALDQEINRSTQVDNAQSTRIDTAQDTANIAQTSITQHSNRIDNPHNVTKSQVGLSNVDNTADLNKPISSATQTALNNKVDKEVGKGLSSEDYTLAEKSKLAGIQPNATQNQTDAYLLNRSNHTGTQAVSTITGLQASLDDKIPLAQKAANNGVATLDAGGKVPVSQLPSGAQVYRGTWSANTNTPTLANGTGSAGDTYRVVEAGTVNFGAGDITFSEGDDVIYNGTIWQRNPSSQTVVSVNGQQGAVVLDKDDIGLSNVDNTSDINKPISTAQQSALDTKVDKELGKGLSTNDFTDAYETNLNNQSGINTGDQDLSGLATTTALNNEITNRTNADSALQTSINNEITRATTAENQIQSNLATETTNRQNADTTLSNRLDTFIDDTQVLSNKTWSSQRIVSQINNSQPVITKYRGSEGESFTVFSALIGRSILSLTRSGIEYDVITAGTPGNGQVLFNSSNGRIDYQTTYPLSNQEFVKIESILTTSNIVSLDGTIIIVPPVATYADMEARLSSDDPDIVYQYTVLEDETQGGFVGHYTHYNNNLSIFIEQ